MSPGGGSYKSLLAGSLVFLGAFSTTFLASSIFTPVVPSSAQDIGAVINASGYYLNLTNANTVSMDLATTASGTIGIAKDTINIKSNAPDGYDLYLSMNNNDTDGNRLYKDANPGTATSPNPYLSPTSGTFSSPTPLDTNSWGYALANTTTGLPTAGSSFDATYNASVPDQNSKWAGVPLAGNEQLLQTITTPNSTEGINTDIYYGVKANTALPSGSYKGTVTYTAVARTSSQVGDTISVSPSVTTKLEGGETLTIATMLNIDANDAEDANNPVSVTVGGQACTNVSLSNAQDGSLTISCTAPSMATGKYDVGVDVSKYSKFWVIVNGIQYKYSTQELDQVTGGNATAADILLGKTAYVGGQELTGTMPSYTLQYDTNKTEAENTADAGLTWSSDNQTLTISEGYHTEQQVNAWTYTPVISSLTELVAGRTRGYPSNTTAASTTPRTFSNTSYVVGMSRDNYYSPSTVSSFSVTNSAVAISAVNGGYGIAFPTNKLTPQKFYRIKKCSYSGSGLCAITFYGGGHGQAANRFITDIYGNDGTVFQVPLYATHATIDFVLGSPSGTATLTDFQLEEVAF